MTEGFASELYAALTAVRNSGVTSKQLVDAASGAKASLKAKAHDIALIYDGYLAALEGKQRKDNERRYKPVIVYRCDDLIYLQDIQPYENSRRERNDEHHDYRQIHFKFFFHNIRSL